MQIYSGKDLDYLLGEPHIYANKEPDMPVVLLDKSVSPESKDVPLMALNAAYTDHRVSPSLENNGQDGGNPLCRPQCYKRSSQARTQASVATELVSQSPVISATSVPSSRPASGATIEPLADERFDKDLTADTQLFRHSVKLRKRCAGEIHGNSLQWMHHPQASCEKTADVLPLSPPSGQSVRR